MNFDVIGDHDSPRSIREEDDLDLTVTDQEDNDLNYVGPFRESPDVKKG